MQIKGEIRVYGLLALENAHTSTENLTFEGVFIVISSLKFDTRELEKMLSEYRDRSKGTKEHEKISIVRFFCPF